MWKRKTRKMMRQASLKNGSGSTGICVVGNSQRGRKKMNLIFYTVMKILFFIIGRKSFLNKSLFSIASSHV